MKRTAKPTAFIFLKFESTGSRILAWVGTSFVLVLLVNLVHIVFAEDSNNERLISRPVIEYNSGDLRDPFADLFQVAIEEEQKAKEVKVAQLSQADIEPQKLMPNLDKFKVQGVIWGGRFPQAVINNKVLVIGDLIEGAEIINIEKKGITLSFAGREVNLAAPGNAPVSKKGNKEVK